MATNTDKIINPFKEQDIEFVELPSEDTRYGSEVLGNLKEMQVGSGKYAFYSDESGIWLGGKTFATAKFKVDMEGNCTATSIILTGYTTSSDVTTIIGNTVTTSYVNALSIRAGSVSADDITSGSIVGSTLSTATSGQRVVLTSTLAEYYNSSGTKIATTYADTSYFNINAGLTTSGKIFVNMGSSTGAFSWAFGNSIGYSLNENYFYTTLDADLGTSAYRWGKIYSDDINCGDIVSGDIDVPFGTITLGGVTISDWSDISSAPTPSQIEDILDNDLGGVTNLTLRVRRVDSGGVDSGWYQLSVDYGLIVGYSVNS